MRDVFIFRSAFLGLRDRIAGNGARSSKGLHCILKAGISGFEGSHFFEEDVVGILSLRHVNRTELRLGNWLELEMVRVRIVALLIMHMGMSLMLEILRRMLRMHWKCRYLGGCKDHLRLKFSVRCMGKSLVAVDSSVR